MENLYKIFQTHKEGGWIMQPYNAVVLYDFVKEHDIKKVLDLGTGIGCSAAIIAQALQEKGVDYHIDTVEHFDKCIKIAKKLIPQELKKHITFHKSKIKTWTYEKMPYKTFSIYETVPEGDYDLIINDGPPPFMENGYWVDLHNGTVTKMLLADKIKPGCFIAWDGRQLMLKTLEQYFGDNFYLSRGQSKSDDLNIIKRKDNPVTYNDYHLEIIKETTYFNEITDTNNS